MSALTCTLALVALLTNGPFVATAGPTAASGRPTEIVRKAITIYQARELKSREYRYVELDDFSGKGLEGKLQDSEVYEVIPLGPILFRRHVAHNGRPLPPLEQENEQQRLDRAIKEMEERFKNQVENPEAKLPDDHAPPGTPVSGVMYDAQFASWQLDLHSLPEGFSFRLLPEEVSEGRKLFVVEGKPTGGVSWPHRGALALYNFDIKLWIDQNELELVKFEAHAKSKGILARPQHAVINRKEFPGASGERELDSLYESNLWYGRGTVITREWKKVNDEVWLPASLHVKGKMSIESDYPNGDHGTATWPMEQNTTFYDYEKFRVTHRILPDFTEKKK
jgi:hypothetical protein